MAKHLTTVHAFWAELLGPQRAGLGIFNQMLGDELWAAALSLVEFVLPVVLFAEDVAVVVAGEGFAVVADVLRCDFGRVAGGAFTRKHLAALGHFGQIDKLAAGRAVHFCCLHQIGWAAGDEEGRQIAHLGVGIVPSLAILGALGDAEGLLLDLIAEEAAGFGEVRCPAFFRAHADVDVNANQREVVAHRILTTLEHVLGQAFADFAGDRVLHAVLPNDTVLEVHDVVLRARVVLEVIRHQRGVDGADAARLQCHIRQ